MNDWKSRALELHENGKSWRSIARKLGKSKSTVSDYLRKQTKGYVRPKDRKNEVEVNKISKSREGTKLVLKHEGREYEVSPMAHSEYSWTREVAPKTHLIIADTQVKPDQDLTYLKNLGKYILHKKPDVIIHIGDHFDMESLSSYDRGKLSFEGRRVYKDLKAGLEGMRALTEEFYGVDGYFPKMVFTLGNHEFRLERFISEHPEFEGLLGVETFSLESFGWTVSPFLKPYEVDGINYVHYLANPFTGKPYGGSALNQLKNVGNSFVVGHKQCLDVAIRPTLDGKMQLGIINGAFYPHFEDYKGFQGNNHFRGITVLHEVKDGFGLPMFVSLDHIMDKYK